MLWGRHCGHWLGGGAVADALIDRVRQRLGWLWPMPVGIGSNPAFASAAPMIEGTLINLCDRDGESYAPRGKAQGASLAR